MKIWTFLVGVKLQPDQHPKTPVIHKVGGYGSDITRGLYALADTWDGGHAGPTSFFTKLYGMRQKAEILHGDFGSVSVTSLIKGHGGTYRGFREVFPAISRCTSGQSELFGIGQNA